MQTWMYTLMRADINSDGITIQAKVQKNWSNGESVPVWVSNSQNEDTISQ